MVWYFHLFQNFPQVIVIHTVKGFGIVNEAKIDVFLELSCFFHDPVDVGNLISGSSALSKTSLNIWKFTVHRLLKPGLDSILICRDITLPTKVHLVKAMVFPVVMYGCKSWTVKKAEHQRTDAFELWCWRRLKSSLDCKEIQPVHSEGNQSWVFIGRTDAKAETPILWLPDAKS